MAIGNGNCKHIPIPKIGGNCNLFLNCPLQRKHFVSEAGGLLKFLGLSGCIHLFFYFCNQISGAPFKEHDRFIHLLPVNLWVHIQATRRQAAFHLAMETGTCSCFEIFGAALAQFKGFVYSFECLTNRMRRSKWTKVDGIIFSDFTYDGKTGILLVRIQAQ